MALTITSAASTPGKAAKRPLNINADRAGFIGVYTIAFDTSYPTGGESISAVFDDFKSVVAAFALPRSGYVFDIDTTADAEKILAYYADYDAGSDGALIEVPNTTNLSALTGVILVVIGY